MPFLRPVGAAPTAPPLAIRSAKTIIGSNNAKCDVVLSRDRGVLELHALLSLDDDKATATLVPFAVTSNGACFVNGRLVPPEGATIVHGDRIALGNADHAFVFSLTDATPSLQNDTRSFRRTLDALRSDPASPLRSKKPEPQTDVETSTSRNRLEKFLLDASTDSLLGDFVERKLRSSSSRRRRPTAMEPPPSLPTSSVSSLRSSLNDSIIDRQHQREVDASGLQSSQSLLSTAERNYAEIEKLRLSQRLREVNNVLNGHLGFGSSYLSTERRSSGTASMRFSSPVKTDRKSHEKNNNDESSEDEEESTEELPTLVEKRQWRPLGESTVPQPMKVSMPSSSAKNIQSKDGMTHEDSLGNDEDDDVAVNESLPSFSEAILKPPKREADVSNTLPPSVPTVSDPTVVALPAKARSQLHQQLIDRTLRRKRHEVLTAAFHRWRRGLRVQQQRRREKSKQFERVDKAVQLLRRNNSFWRWKRWTERKHQVLECREEAFVNRLRRRLVQTLWIQWVESTRRATHKRRFLRRCVVAVYTSRVRWGFQRLRVQSEHCRRTSETHDLVRTHEENMEKRMQAIAQRHHERRIATRYLACVLRSWHRVASHTAVKKRVLYRMLHSGCRRHQLRAWNTWKQTALLLRHVEASDKQRQSELAMATHAAAQHLATREKELQDRHEHQQRELQAKLEEQQRAVRSFENENRNAKKRLADAKAEAKSQWTAVSEAFLKQSIAEADASITDVSARLEAFLQQMDIAAETARFQAASFLVETMLQQKVHHVNARVEAQEAMLQAMVHNDTPSPDTIKAPGATAWKTALTNNGYFLLEMLQQRHARLHQLHQAIAKLAATVVEADALSRTARPRIDAAKLKHAAFLTDTMHDRTVEHLDAVLALHFRRCAFASSTEARKY